MDAALQDDIKPQTAAEAVDCYRWFATELLG